MWSAGKRSQKQNLKNQFVQFLVKYVTTEKCTTRGRSVATIMCTYRAHTSHLAPFLSFLLRFHENGNFVYRYAIINIEENKKKKKKTRRNFIRCPVSAWRIQTNSVHSFIILPRFLLLIMYYYYNFLIVCFHFMWLLFFAHSLTHSLPQRNHIIFVFFRGYVSSIPILFAPLFAALFSLLKYNNGNKVKKRRNNEGDREPDVNSNNQHTQIEQNRSA